MTRLERNGEIEEESSLPAAAAQPQLVRPGLLQVIWHRRWILLLVTAASLGAGLIYLTQATPIFRSASRLYVEQRGPRILSDERGVMAESKNYLFTQAELLRSMPILAAALEAPTLRQAQTFADIDNPLACLRKDLQTGVGKKDDIITVMFESPYPEEAAQVVNAVVDAYVTYHARRKRTTAGEVLKILQKEKVKRDAELSGKMKSMLDFKRSNPALSFEDKSGNIIVRRLARLSEALTAAQLATIDTKAIYEATRSMMNDSDKIRQFVEAQRAKGVYVSTHDEEARLRGELHLLQVQLASLKRECTGDHPAVKALELEIAEVSKQMGGMDEKFAAAHLAIAAQQYASAEQKEEQVRNFFERQRKEALNLNATLAEYAMLQSEWEQTKKLVDILDDRIKEINVTEDVGALNISILEVARAATEASKPEKARTMVIALVVGLALGVGLTLVRDWMDHRLHSSGEISAALGVPVVGVVATMSGRKDMVAHGQKVHLEPQSNIAEAYRTIRTAVYFGLPEGRAKTLLVTSPAAGDGKTTLVSNLAIAMAQAGRRTLVLDADFRRPMQHRVFELEDGQGLSNVLAGRESAGKVIRRTAVEGLEVLPCGPIPPNPSEMLNSQGFARVLEELARQYDYVLIDSPPVMPVTDARILGAMCGVTVVVVRAEKTTRRAAEQAREGLLSVGANILGVVVNAAPRRRRHYGYDYGYGYYGYGYGYRYGYGRKSRERQGDGAARSEPVVAAKGNEGK